MVDFFCIIVVKNECLPKEKKVKLGSSENGEHYITAVYMSCAALLIGL